MLRVFYSNETEELLSALVEQIDASRRSVFEPVRLVVPNDNMAVYVKLGLARLSGISANVESRRLRRFLDDATGRPEADARLFDAVLATLFDEAFLAEPVLAPVSAYLHGSGDPPGLDRRRVQLASEVARLFRTYEVSRPEILECWRAGLRFEDAVRAEAEAWQRQVWARVRDALGPASWQLLAAPPRVAPEPEPAHLFGTPYVARTDAEALARLARDRDIFVYTLNPCQEIWEAFKEPLPLLPSNRRYERRGSELGPGEVFSTEDPFRLSNPGELRPLRLWGRPARESLRLLNTVSGCELVARVKAPAGASLLQTLQRDIVLRRPDRTSSPHRDDFRDDTSIVFMECTSPRRELEAVAAEIWKLVSDDESRPGSRFEPLRFHEIAVLLVPAEAHRYQSLVASVFAELSELPFNIVDLPIRGESRIAEAASLLLTLPLGRFGREEVLRFVTHPVVASSFPDADPGEWMRMCERLGIYRGADRRDRKNTYVEKDLFNWEQGLARLALGVFAPEGSRFEKGEDTYLAAEASFEAGHGLGLFALLVRSLLADAREAGRVSMTLPAWADFLSAFVSTYLKPRSESDRKVLDRCLGAIGSLAELPLGGRKVRYAVAHELVARKLDALSGSRGAYLTDGVVVSSFLPMRAIPFKVVFVVGLAESDFPARERETYLDLSRAVRRAGDVSPRDEDRYLFLETLLCAREKLYLSYVSRDERTGEPLSPSSLVLELQETLAGYVSRDNLDVRTQPFHRHEDPASAGCSSSSHSERNAVLVGEELRQHLDGKKLDYLAALPESVRAPLGLVEVPHVAARSARPARTSLTLSALRRFLECPLQGSARYFLKLDEAEDEERLFSDEEPLATPPVIRAAIVRETLASGGSDELYHRLRESYELRGLVPTGVLGETEAREHLELLRLYREGLRKLVSRSDARVVLGRDSPPLVLTNGSSRIELLASPELEVELSGLSGSRRRMGVRLVSQSSARFHPGRESLRGFLQHVFAAAAAREDEAEGDAGATEFAVLNAKRGSLEIERFEFRPVCRDEARSYLVELASDLSEGAHAYLLPCESVLDPTGAVAPDDAFDLARTSSRYGPVVDLLPYEPPRGARREELIDRRFGLYFRLRNDTGADGGTATGTAIVKESTA